jgi:hypothetical protein
MHHAANRISRTVAVAALGVAVGLATTFTVANSVGSDQRPHQESPAERAAIAEWAREHHLTGLSPTSLASNSEYTWTPRLASEMAAIADFARDQGLSGLSPASLQPTGD